jgi:hypothetical protein
MQNRLRNSTPHMLTGLFCAQRKAGILQTPSTDFRASVWHLKEAIGIYLYTYERQRTCAERSKADDDGLQSKETYVHFRGK